jgi:hypothetical protein
MLPLARTLAATLAAALVASAGAQPPAKTPPKAPGNTPPANPAPAPTNTPAPTSANPAPQDAPRYMGGPTDVDDIIKFKAKADRTWTINAEVRIFEWKRTDAQGKPYGTGPLKLETAAILWPLPKSTAAHDIESDDVKSELIWNKKEEEMKPKLLAGYPAGTRLLRWELRDREGTEMTLKVGWNVRCKEIESFDDAKAMTIGWPSAYPAESASTFKSQIYLDFINKEAERAAHDQALRAQLTKWFPDVDSKKTPPAKLAKEIMGKVLESVQERGQGLRFNRTSSLQGFDVMLPADVLERKLGSEHEIANLLTAMYRVAGIPARTVIGWDMSHQKFSTNPYDTVQAGGGKFRTWTEFCLVDPKSFKELWIPVDITRQRKNGSRSKPIDKPWAFFGSNEDSAYIIPIAFQFHPPAEAASYGSPAFWGWLVTPSTPSADQSVRIAAAFPKPIKANEKDPKDANKPTKTPSKPTKNPKP